MLSWFADVQGQAFLWLFASLGVGFMVWSLLLVRLVLAKVGPLRGEQVSVRIRPLPLPRVEIEIHTRCQEIANDRRKKTAGDE